MITRRVCVGGLDPHSCLIVREVGRGTPRLAIVYADACMEVAARRLARELKNSTKLSIAFVSLYDVIKSSPRLQYARDVIEPNGDGFAERVVRALIDCCSDYEVVIEVKCVRDVIPFGMVCDESAEIPFRTVVRIPELVPKYLRALRDSGKNVALLWIECGTDFTREELDSAIKIVKDIVHGVSEGGEKPEVLEPELVRSSSAGIFVPSKRVGEEVVEGEEIGFVDDEKIMSPRDGVLVYVSRGREVAAGDLLAIVVRDYGKTRL